MYVENKCVRTDGSNASELNTTILLTWPPRFTTS